MTDNEKNREIVDKIVDEMTLDITACSNEHKRQLREVGMKVARYKDEKMKEMLQDVLSEIREL